MLLVTSRYANQPAEAPAINTTNINLHFQANAEIHYWLLEQFQLSSSSILSHTLTHHLMNSAPLDSISSATVHHNMLHQQATQIKKH